MQKLVWQDAFNIDHGEIDEQHKQWIVIINELSEAIDEDENISKQVVIQALKAVDHYTRFHFEEEEAFMQRVNYPEYEAHKELHKSLLKKVKKYMADIEKDNVEVDEILSVLSKWFPKHILKEDIKLASYS